jgi:hypothetical protein
MLKRTAHRRLWVSTLTLALIGVCVAWLVFYRLSPLGLWLLAQRSQAIAYAEFRADSNPRYAYITDTWKQSHGPEQLAIGAPIDFVLPYCAVQPPPNGVLLFFESGSSREFHHLRGSTRMFFHTDARRVWWDRHDLSFQEAKALCQRTIGI